MLFDLHPKETPESLYGRDTDLSKVIKHIENRRWVAILGSRMIGKTSLVKAAKCGMERQGVVPLYINLRGINSVIGLLTAIVQVINESSDLYKKVKQFLTRINGLNVGPMGLSLVTNQRPVNITFNLLSVLGEHSDELVIILDELQELKTVSGHLLNILANIFATYPNITFCFTGSYLGLVKSLLEPDSHSPLYGRSPVKISVGTFDKSLSKAFLLAGFKEQNIVVPNENIDEVIDRFGGIPGWLTLYGNAVTISGLSHKEALTLTEGESFKIQKRVIQRYLEGKNRTIHLTALRAIAVQSTWSEVRRAIEAHTGETLNDASLKNIIDIMTSSIIIEKTNLTYRIIDPTLRRFLLSGIPIH